MLSSSSMQRRWVLIASVVLVSLGAAGLLLKGRISPTKAGLQVRTNPQAQVFINGDQAGNTPLESDSYSPGEITLRLVPIAVDSPLSTWETKLTLAPGIKTVVRRDFGETATTSSGEVLSFEKIPGNEAGLTIVSSPDSAQVKLNGQVKGFTPIRIDSLGQGEHDIVVSHPGYAEKTIKARTESGYRLTVVAMLAQTEEPVEEEKKEEIIETKVEILSTPVGFLRVREEASTASTELGRVEPEKTYVFVEENEDSTWFKIEYESGREGWVSAQYAKKVEGEP